MRGARGRIAAFVGSYQCLQNAHLRNDLPLMLTSSISFPHFMQCCEDFYVFSQGVYSTGNSHLFLHSYYRCFDHFSRLFCPIPQENTAVFFSCQPPKISPLHTFLIYGIITMYDFIVSAGHRTQVASWSFTTFLMPFCLYCPKGEGVQGMDAEGKGYRET